MVFQATSGAAVTKISTTAVTVTAGTATLSLTNAVAGLPSGKTFPGITNKVFKLCVYPVGFEAVNVTGVCGSYHTFGASSVDRNMGQKSTSWTVKGGSGNFYTQTLYSGIYESTTGSVLNFGLVAVSTGSASF
jgi:hypothetical protein